MLWIIDAMLLTIGTLLVAGALARRWLRRRHPAPGRIVRVGRRQLHIDVRGEGEPAVVFVSGLGDHSASWQLVQPTVAAFARSVSYDRAGLGWSPGSAGRRTAADAVDELHALLATQVPGPYLLVGHSYGGLVARLFAHRHPEAVAGLVLVDAAHEDQFARAPESIRSLAARMGRLVGPMYVIPRLLAWIGLVALRPRLVPTAIADAPAEAFDAESYRAIVAAHAGRALRASVAEMKGLDESQSQLRAARGSLGDLPVTVIVHGRPAPMPPSIPAPDRQRNEALWRELAQEVAATSSRGRLVVAEGAGHAVHVEAPDVVIDAIRQVVGELRASAPGRRPDPAADGPARSRGQRAVARAGWVARGIVGRVLRTGTALAAAVFVLFMLGVTYETVAAAGDAATHAVPGRLVDVGGHRLHLDCAGEGSPTVLIDAGGGDFSLGWQHVQAQAAETTRVCAYDRAGHGWSDPGPMPRSADRVVTELDVLLRNAGEEGPYVLVGASLSAKYVRLFADRHPDQVVGVVIADGRHESFDTHLGQEFMDRAVRMTGTMNGIQNLLHDSGVMRLFGTPLLTLLHGEGIQDALGSEARTYGLLVTDEAMLEAFASELGEWEATNAALAGTSLGTIPLVVLSHGEALPVAEQEAAWQAAQAAQAALSSSGQVRIVAGSGHAIQFDAPDAVVEAIRDVVSAAGR